MVSLVNPHDVLGYPAQHVEGGYAASDFRDLGVELPPTLDEDLRDKPAVHELMKMGMDAYLGPLRSERAKLDYVNFYAHLHRVVDEKVGRVLAALGDPDSLRSRTLIFRCADHGEMGLSHGGLRQKAFNAYEETIHIPLVVSNPVLFPQPVQTDALASLVDVLPTIASVAGAQLDAEVRGRDLTPILAAKATPEGERLRRSPADLGPITGHRAPATSVQEEIHFTYDDHQAATALQNVPGQPNRIRAVRTPGAQVCALLRSGRRGCARVRDVRPGARPRREREPRRPLERRGRECVRSGLALGAGRAAPRPDARQRHGAPGPVRPTSSDKTPARP